MAAAYQLLQAGRALGLSQGGRATASLRVLIYHDIPPAEHGWFAAQLRWLKRSWNFVSPPEFAALLTGEESIRGRHVLLTFDDGFASNRQVAEQILNPMGIRAVFFVVSDFVDLRDREEAQHFIAHGWNPGVPPERVPSHLYNMGWSDLEALLEQGHTVGGHSRTHARLSEIHAEAALEREIISGANRLERQLGLRVEHFAFPYGDIASISAQALTVARRRFRFIHSGLRGDNAAAMSPYAIRREAASARDSKALLGAYLEGLADFHYARSRALVDSWVQGQPQSTRARSSAAVLEGKA